MECGIILLVAFVTCVPASSSLILSNQQKTGAAIELSQGPILIDRIASK